MTRDAAKRLPAATRATGSLVALAGVLRCRGALAASNPNCRDAANAQRHKIGRRRAVSSALAADR